VRSNGTTRRIENLAARKMQDSDGPACDGVANRMPNPKEHLRWLSKWWGRISEWPV
jgi:hypothetical protein